jgi:inosine-uridine nucleoside N-ribohydrolase
MGCDEKRGKMKKKVIIDCDVGVDDALALILAFHSPEIEVLAVTGVNGNVPLKNVMPNIRKVLTLLQPVRPPLIAGGADRPLQGSAVHARHVHGEDGLGGTKIHEAEDGRWWRLSPEPADDLILHLARERAHEITLIAIGPLTNLARAFAKDKETLKKIGDLVIMGGAVRTAGNVTPHAEFNFYVDPQAARIVLESGLPITMVPLDATHQVPLTAEAMEEKVQPLDSPFARFVTQATGYDRGKRLFRNGRKEFFLHDPLAVGAVICPDLVRTERVWLSVVTEAGEQLGQCLERSDQEIKSPQIDVCLGVDRDKFLELFLSRLEA